MSTQEEELGDCSSSTGALAVPVEPASGLAPDGLQSADAVAELIRPTLDKFVSAAAPYLHKVSEELYERLLYSVQDYLRENGEWNIGEEIARCRQIERDNIQLHLCNAPLTDALIALEALLAEPQDETRRHHAQAYAARARSQLRKAEAK